MKPELGVCYYPEQWPQSMWRNDAERMRDNGIRWVRIGEFAWSRIEPEPDRFDWTWLDQSIDTLGDAGLKVVLGTPTATPPRWMLKKHPDMLALDSDGQPRGFGSRRHYDFSHLGYRDESARICGILSKRFAEHPALCFWQTDNEYGCHETTVSYSANALAGFRSWLAERYGDIQSLNSAWGNVFWSMEYADFEEIDLPSYAVTEANPIHHHDFRRYSSEQVLIFNRIQVETIRHHDPSTPILHNFMGRITDFDHFAMGKDLDAASWDSYPLGFLEDRLQVNEDHKQAYLRQGDPDFQAFHHDLYRAVGNGRWWVMEQQPGPVNWAPFNPAPLPGMVRLWAWEAIAHGAEVVSFFRWRQAPFAQEQMHAGLMRPDDQPAPALQEIKQLAEEISNQEQDTQKASVVIVFDYESAWAWETQPHGAGFDYFMLVFEQYRALRKLGLSIDFCPSDSLDFSDYKLVLVPGLMYWNSNLRQALDKYDGMVLVGPRSGSKTCDFSIPEQLPPDCPELIDVKVTHIESLPPSAPIALQDSGQVQHWREILEVGSNVKVRLATSNDEAILLQQKHIFYLGGRLDEDAGRQVIQILCDAAGLSTLELPAGVRIRQWGNSYVVTNYASEPRDISILSNIASFPQDLLQAADVAIGVKRLS